MLVHSGGNGADLAQQFLRPSTTLTAFHQRHGIAQIEMLASELVWGIARAMQAFTEWQQFDSQRMPQPSRQRLLRNIEERIAAANDPANDQREMSLASPLVQALQLNEEQERQMRNAFEEFEEGDLDPHALLVAFVISQELQLPQADGVSLFRPLFSLIRQPLAGAGAGRIERDLGDAMCILSDILNHRIPAQFRQAFVSQRRRRSRGPIGGLLIIAELQRLGALGTRDAPAHDHPHELHPMTDHEIREAINREHPELREQRGHAAQSWPWLVPQPDLGGRHPDGVPGAPPAPHRLPRWPPLRS